MDPKPYTFKSTPIASPSSVALDYLTVGDIYEVDLARGDTVVDLPVLAVWNGAVFLRGTAIPVLPCQPCPSDIVGGWPRLRIGTIAPGINAGDLDALDKIMLDLYNPEQPLYANLYTLGAP